MRLEEQTGEQVVGRPHPVAPRLRPVGARRRILVVDDNPVNRMVAEGMVRALGHECETAEDGVAALDQLDRSAFDLVLLDVQMPRLDGYATARAMRADEHLARIPVVAMTAAAIDGERERCLASGMDDFLTKPIDPGGLARILDAWLDRSRTQPVSSEAPAAPRVTDELDLARLDILRDLVPGSTAYLDRAIGNFVNGCPALLASVERAIRQHDPADLRFQAHTLKGSAANLGAVAAARAAERLELLGADGTVTGAADLLVELADRLDRACAGLQAYQASYSVAETA
jgi:CheY-like chemotaxis protein